MHRGLPETGEETGKTLRVVPETGAPGLGEGESPDRGWTAGRVGGGQEEVEGEGGSLSTPEGPAIGTVLTRGSAHCTNLEAVQLLLQGGAFP